MLMKFYKKGTMQSINGDMAKRVAMHTPTMDWQSSPSRTVWRKRVHLVGGAESGQVTSLVRYEKNAAFPRHDHPGGEEIFVLEGVFSDEHGDWPAGTYLLNPEGFRHAPFSQEGCLLFVKLRQYPGTNRSYLSLRTHELAWESTSQAGIATKILYTHPDFPETTRLERWHPGTDSGPQIRKKGAELFILEGSLEDEAGRYEKFSWLRLPVDTHHHPVSPEGCLFYIKTGGLASLRSVSSDEQAIL